MGGFETFDLGRAIQTAESIKSMRRQSSLDTLREQATRGQISAQEQAMTINASQEKRAETQYTAEQRLLGTRTLVAAASAVEADPTPETIALWKPELEKAGVQLGDYGNATPEQIKAYATKIKTQYGGFLDSITRQNPEFAKLDAQHKLSLDELAAGHKLRLEEISATGTENRKTAAARPADGSVNQQLVTRPVGEGLVQDFAWNPRTNQREPSGEPYKPVTPHTGNVTEGERKAAALGTRLESAMNVLNDIETRAPGASRPGLLERGLEAVGGETAANAVRGSERQQADSAQLDALDAALTLATGAAYTREQLQNLRKSYFPQIGDSDANVAAKRKRFETIVETARIASGRAEPAIDRALDNDTTQPGTAKPSGASGAQPDFVWVPGKGLQQAP